MKALGACLLPLIGGTVSISWLLNIYRSNSDKQRNFSRLLIIGMCFYLLSNLIWLFVQLQKGETAFPKMSQVFWLLAYSFFLSAIVYRLKDLNKSISNAPVFYNMLISMLALISLSIQYFINPLIEYSSHSVIDIILNLSYPIADLFILLAIINLYYASRHTKEKKILLMISVGFLIQVIADIFYLLNKLHYQFPNFVEPLWMLSILIIGLSGFYVTNQFNEETEELPHFYTGYDGIFLNISVIFLIFLVVHENNLKIDPLIVGLILTVILIVARKIVIIKKNHNLVQKLSHQAYRDQLTGLNNRLCFQQDLKKIMERAKKNNNKMAILLLDLDRFKNVNDTLGHHIGDYLLKVYARRLEKIKGVSDRLYRVGGDEFVIMIPDASEQYCIKIASKVLEDISETIFVQDYEISITPSIGISLYPDNGESSEVLLKNADASMYQAKNIGGSSFQFFDSELNAIISRKMQIENELKRAIEREQLQVYYQPKLDLNTQKLVGMEALLRWTHPQLGFISPAEFIPIAEESGQIISIGEWVLRTACKQTKLWQDAGYPHIRVSINVSARQFEHSDFINLVREILEEVAIDEKYIELEITESIMKNIEESTIILHKLRELGVKISIDDFGTGYSSLYVLKKLPIDAIKIDKSFVDDITEEMDKSIIYAIIDIGFNLNLEVVIEGIENEAQVKRLMLNKSMINNTIIGQGYLFGKPMEVEVFEAFMSTYK